MYDPSNEPSEGMEQARAETPRTEGTPTVNIGQSYVPPPPYSQAPAPPPPPPGYGYNMPPQTGYAQPPPTANFGQGQGQGYGGPPTINTGPGAPSGPMYQPGQYGGGYQPAPPPGAYGVGYTQPKDPTMGLMLELIGLLGFLGIGHIWAGKTNRGIGLLIGWIVYDILLVTVIVPLVTLGTVFTCGLGCVFFLPLIAIWIGVPLWSGIYLKNEMQREQAAMGFRR